MEYAALAEIRVVLSWDPSAQKTFRQFGRAHLRDDAHLRSLLRDAYANWQRIEKSLGFG